MLFACSILSQNWHQLGCIGSKKKKQLDDHDSQNDRVLQVFVQGGCPLQVFFDVRTALLALLSVVPRCSCLYAQVCRTRSTAVSGSFGLLNHCYTNSSLVSADKTHTVELCASDTVQDVKAVVEARQGMHRD